MEIKEAKFQEVLKDAMDKYESRKEKYGESWKQMSCKELGDRLREELEEFFDVAPFPEEGEPYKELLDIINICLMLASQYKRRIIR